MKEIHRRKDLPNLRKSCLLATMMVLMTGQSLSDRNSTSRNDNHSHLGPNRNLIGTLCQTIEDNKLISQYGVVYPDQLIEVSTSASEEVLQANMLFKTTPDCSNELHFKGSYAKIISFWLRQKHGFIVLAPFDSQDSQDNSMLQMPSEAKFRLGSDSVGEIYRSKIMKMSDTLEQNGGFKMKTYSSMDKLRNWIHYSIKVELFADDPPTSPSPDQRRVRFRIFRGLSSIEDSSTLPPSSVIDTDAKRQDIDLVQCTNLKLIHQVDLSEVDGDYQDFFSSVIKDLILKTKDCTFAAIKTLHITQTYYQLIEDLGDSVTPTPLRGNLLKSLMMGGSFKLLGRLHFNNMDSSTIKKILNSSFTQTKFRELSSSFKDGFGVKTSSPQAQELFRNTRSSLNKDIEKMRTISIDPNFYLYKEMSSTIIVESFQLISSTQPEIFSLFLCYRLDLAGCLIEIKTDTTTDNRVTVSWKRLNQIPTESYQPLITGQQVAHPLTKYLVSISLLPLDMAISPNGDQGFSPNFDQFKPMFLIDFTFSLHYYSGTQWSSIQVAIKGQKTFGPEMGSDFSASQNLRFGPTRGVNIKYTAGSSNVQHYLDEIRFYNGGSITVGESTLINPVVPPTGPHPSTFARYQQIKEINSQSDFSIIDLHSSWTSSNGVDSTCLLRSVFQETQCLSCNPNNAWYDEQSGSCIQSPTTNQLDQCEIYFNSKICKKCKQGIAEPINEGHGIFEDMTRRGMCVNQKMGCPHQKGYYQFTEPTDRLNPILSRQCHTCPMNCMRCFESDNWCLSGYSTYLGTGSPTGQIIAPQECLVQNCRSCERSPCDRCQPGYVVKISNSLSYSCTQVTDPLPDPACAPYQTYWMDGFTDINGQLICVEYNSPQKLVGFNLRNSGPDMAPCGTPGVDCSQEFQCQGSATFPLFPEYSDPFVNYCIGNDNFCSQSSILNDCLTCPSGEHLTRLESSRITCGCEYGKFRTGFGQCQDCDVTNPWCKQKYQLLPFQAMSALAQSVMIV